MNNVKLLGPAIFFLGLIGFAFEAFSVPAERNVYVASVRGTIDPASASYLKASIKKAEAADSEALIIELDTPGGLVSSVRDMAQAIDKSKVPVVVYVTPAGASATSAGALLALASHVAAMAPGSNIGAAHPVSSEGKDIAGKLGEKAANDVAAFARGLAELRKRNRELAEAVVLKSKSLTAEEAQKQELVEIIAASRSELLHKLDGKVIAISKDETRVIRSTGATIKTAEMTWGQKILHLIANPNIATMLMALGVLAIYIEITTPGITIPGIVGGISILTAFIAFQMLPIRVGGLLLMVLGIGLMIAEAFVVSHGALAAGGIISFLLGILWIFDPEESDISISAGVWVPVVITLSLGVGVLAVAAARMRKLVQKTYKEIGGGGAAGLLGYTGKIETLSESGRSGKILVRGETWDFQSSEVLKFGQTVEVERVEGFKVFVKPVSKGET